MVSPGANDLKMSTQPVMMIIRLLPDNYLDRLEKWRAERQKKVNNKSVAQPLQSSLNSHVKHTDTYGATRKLGCVTGKSTSCDHDQPSFYASKRNNPCRATQEISRPLTKRNNPRRATQEIDHPINKRNDPRRATQEISFHVKKELNNRLSQSSNALPKSSSNLNDDPRMATRAIRLLNQNIRRITQVIPRSAKTNYPTTSQVTHPVTQPSKSEAKRHVNTRRLTHEVKAPLKKRTDSRRLTQPISRIASNVISADR